MTRKEQRHDPGFSAAQSQPKSFGRKIVAFIGVIFVALAVLLAAYNLLAASGTTSTPESVLRLVAVILASVFGAVGLGLLLAGLVLVAIPGESPAASVVNSFYIALENQDYSTAFQCLDPYMRIPQSHYFSSDGFVQAARASDSAQGQVTDYALAGVQANPGKRVYTIKVTRGGSSYRTRLRLEKQGYVWKIVGLDRLYS